MLLLKYSLLIMVLCMPVSGYAYTWGTSLSADQRVLGTLIIKAPQDDQVRSIDVHFLFGSMLKGQCQHRGQYHAPGASTGMAPAIKQYRVIVKGQEQLDMTLSEVLMLLKAHYDCLKITIDPTNPDQMQSVTFAFGQLGHDDTFFFKPKRHIITLP